MCRLSTVERLDRLLSYLWVGYWIKSKGFVVPPRVDSREQVFSAAAQRIRDQEVLYLEFGVHKGESMKIWSELLRNPGSKLHGFDSFEGIPEAWDAYRKGSFSTNGRVPVMADQRVKFFKGWFNETLPLYVIPPAERLVVNLDADLYSSTKTVLEFIRHSISAGTLLYFDEFQSRNHELKAFDEFLSETGMEFRIIAASQGLSHIVFECIHI